MPPVRIFVDVTRTAGAGFHTGIQKVVRGLLRGMSAEASERGIAVVPVILTRRGAHALPSLPPHPHETGQGPDRKQPASAMGDLRRRARAAFRALERGGVLARAAHAGLRSGLIGLRAARASWNVALLAPPVAFREGDILLLPDTAWQIDPWRAITQARRAGGRVAVILYDVIPLQRPDYFEPGVAQAFRAYVEGLLRNADELVCISRTVRDEVRRYAASRGLPTPTLNWLWPGVVLAEPSAAPTPRLVEAMAHPVVLIVATIEPRKGHDLLLDAAETLWDRGLDFHLVIAGSVGWRVTELLARMGRHPQAERRLHVFHDLRDGEITYALQRARVLAFPSSAEGLGLPILEAELAGCPVVCSDIPVFREIASEHTVLFSPHDADSLAAALRPFVETEAGRTPRPAVTAARQGMGPHDYARRLLDLLASSREPSRPT